MASPINGILKTFTRKFRAASVQLVAMLHHSINDTSTKQHIRDAVDTALEALGFNDIIHDAIKQAMKDSYELNGRKSVSLLPALRSSWDGTGMPLSEKLHGADKEMRKAIIDTVRQQIDLNVHSRDIAMKLYDGYNSGQKVVRQQHLPKYLNDLLTLARRSNMTRDDQQELMSMIRKTRQKIARLSQHGAPNQTLKTAYAQLVDAVEQANEKALQNAIRVGVEEKSRYVAERIARTEAARAWAQGFLEKYDDQENVVAYRWKLSSRHPEVDICNMYADADFYGLGKGIYPKDKIPDLPVHPHCLCHLSPVYRSELEGKKPVDHFEDAGREWLSKQSLHVRQHILGIQGNKAVGNNDSWTKWARNYSGIQINRLARELADSLKPYFHGGTIKIEEIAKRVPGESEDQIKQRVRDYIASPYCTKEFTDRQQIHIKGSPIYDPGKSYYDSDDTLPVDKVIECLPSIDINITSKGDWGMKGVIHHAGAVGHWVSKKGTGETEYSMVHFSNKGLHTVPKRIIGR